MENSLKNFAIEFEIKGVNLYLDLAKKTRNVLGKRLFYSLAQQEVQHAYLFDGVGDVPQIETESGRIKDIESELKDFWNKAEKTEIRKEDEHFSGYELAIEMEKKSISSYRAFLSESKNEKEKEFLNWIIEEEKKHLEALRNVHYYLTQTADWLQGEESKVWNWMNQ
ncbi:MAG: ferritin family protein [Candidatus Omnitrophica bacterium]|nr:ferritin family protein [Candidatus Omnitrophota bacterium]MCM8828023.1 ferritin family protein [Candidatus Omnitrophota bacterium]